MIINYSDYLKYRDKHAYGTYACFTLDERSIDDIGGIIKKFNISRSDPLEDLHCTILYSRKPFPSIEQYSIDPRSYSPVKTMEYEVFEGKDDKAYLVLKLDDNHLRELHGQFLSAGATHDFNSYQPHITITDTFDYSVNLDELELPRYIFFNKIKIEGLNDE